MVQLLEAGVDPTCTTSRSQTALMLVAASSTESTLESIELLITSLGDVNAKDDAGWTPLHYACRNSEQEAAALLMEKGATLDTRTNDGKTAAMLAAIDGCDNLVMNLLNHKAPVDEADENGWTLLTYAVEEGHFGLVKFLLKSKANPSAAAKDRSTPFMVAAKLGDTRMGQALLKRKANPNVGNKVGDTALLLSLKANRDTFATWLINDVHVDVTTKNKAGEDAYGLSGTPDLANIKSILETKLRAAQKEGGQGIVNSRMLENDDDFD